MVIGISGKIGSGKDTVASIIQILTRKEEGKHFSTKSEFWNNTNAVLRNMPNPDWEHVWTFEVRKFADKLKDIVCMLLGCTRVQLESQEFKNTELGQEWWYYKTPKGNIPYDEYEKLRPLVFMETEVELIKQTPRLILQLIGTEGGRDLLHPNVWVNSLFSDFPNYEKLKQEFFSNKGFNDIDLLRKNDKRLYQDIKVQWFEDLGNSGNWLISDMRFPNELDAVKEREGITIRVIRNKSSVQDEYGNDLNFDENKNLIVEHPSETALDTAKFDYKIINNGTIEELIEKVKEILIKEKIL